MSKNDVLARKLQSIERVVTDLEVLYFEAGGYTLSELQLLVENAWFSSSYRRLRSIACDLRGSKPSPLA